MGMSLRRDFFASLVSSARPEGNSRSPVRTMRMVLSGISSTEANFSSFSSATVIFDRSYILVIMVSARFPSAGDFRSSAFFPWLPVFVLSAFFRCTAGMSAFFCSDFFSSGVLPSKMASMSVSVIFLLEFFVLELFVLKLIGCPPVLVGIEVGSAFFICNLCVSETTGLMGWKGRAGVGGSGTGMVVPATTSGLSSLKNSRWAS